MKQRQFLKGRWAVALLITALVLCITPGIPAQACGNGNGQTYTNNGPVYLILSLEQEFYTPDLSENGGPSLTRCTQPPPGRTVIIKIGTYVAGDEIGSTRFDLETGPLEIELPTGITLDDLEGYQITILGAFDTTSPNTVHLVTPDEEGAGGDPIPRKVQEAFFVASPELEELAGPEGEPLFPTTVEIAEFIFQTAIASELPSPDETALTMGEWLLIDHTIDDPEDPRGPALTAQQILDNIFVTDAELSAGVVDPNEPEPDVFAEADGDLYPHQPGDGKPLFKFDFSIDNDDLAIDVATAVEIDVKPGNAQNLVNYDSKGVVWVAILTTVENGEVVFDATTDVDEETVVLGPDEAAPLDSKEQDANRDGYDDLYVKFKVADIGLTKDTTEVTLRGFDYDERSFAGTDLVTTVPPKGKKK